jgi:L-2-hydroxyglutarate oxidase LhgO
LDKHSDVLVIGGGIIGVSTARALLKRQPKLTLALLEKEHGLAQHTSGHNSGVLHAGYNQKPGSLKARLCVEGNRLIREYCVATRLPILENGILVVARRPDELGILQELYRRGKANRAPGLEIIGQNDLNRREPNVVGIQALWAPSGAAVDSSALVHRMAQDAQKDGALFFLNHPVRAIEKVSNGFRVSTPTREFSCSRLINCAGLQADRVAHLLGAGLDYTIVPFRGEYFKLGPGLRDRVHAMVYPTPDLNFPFLGIHWTKTVHGDLKVGPNASIAFGRESYRFWDIHPHDCLEMLSKPGVWRLLGNPDFRRLVRQQIRTSLSRRTFLREATGLIRCVALGDFEPGPAGIRAQLIDRQGRLVDDLLIERKDGALHVLNAVSPGMTCSMAFAEYLCDQV